MTYTFKLARRLAVSRILAVVAASGALACTTGDDLVGVTGQAPGENSLAAVVLTPRELTAEVGQQVQLAVYGRSPTGDTLAVGDVVWTATGGTITSDGVFSASAPGSYTLFANSRGGKKQGQGTVNVVAHSASLTAISITPDSTTVASGSSETFIAQGINSDGTTGPVGVDWDATGGSIDAGGNYVAGQVAGTYLVIATQHSSKLADTAVVTVTGNNEPPAPLPAEPTVESITLTPENVQLASGETQRFSVVRHLSDGTDSPSPATFVAAGGTISSDGVYQAGNTAGTYRIVATDPSGFADTAVVTVTVTVPDSDPVANWYPHAPAGVSTVSDRSFSAIDEDGWSQTLVSRLSIVNDAAAVQSAPFAGQILYPKGFSGGYEPVVTSKMLPSGKTTLYVSFWLKYSPNFVGHPSSGVNKVFHIWIAGSNRVYLSAQGYNSGSLVPQVRLQNVAGGTHYKNLLPNINSSARIVRGQWQHWELLLVTNTGSNADGVAEWWIDGVKAGSYSDIEYVSSDQAHDWDKVQLAPTWGGMGDTVPADQTLRIDHVHIGMK